MQPWQPLTLAQRWAAAGDLLISTDAAGGRQSVALFDAPDAHFRYWLTRCWDPHLRQLAVLMCNPSTADAFKNDPTVAQIEKWARAWNYGGFVVLNVFAFRASKPPELLRCPEPTGPLNLQIIADTLLQLGLWADESPRVLLAWGDVAATTLNKLGRQHHLTMLISQLRTHAAICATVGRCKSGQPRHPRYIPFATEPQLLTDTELTALAA